MLLLFALIGTLVFGASAQSCADSTVCLYASDATNLMKYISPYAFGKLRFDHNGCVTDVSPYSGGWSSDCVQYVVTSAAVEITSSCHDWPKGANTIIRLHGYGNFDTCISNATVDDQTLNVHITSYETGDLLARVYELEHSPDSKDIKPAFYMSIASVIVIGVGGLAFIAHKTIYGGSMVDTPLM